MHRVLKFIAWLLSCCNVSMPTEAAGPSAGSAWLFACAANDSPLMETCITQLGQMPLPRSRSWAVRLLTLTYGLFAVIILASYTAALAAFLTVSAPPPPPLAGARSLPCLCAGLCPSPLVARGALNPHFSARHHNAPDPKPLYLGQCPFPSELATLACKFPGAAYSFALLAGAGLPEVVGPDHSLCLLTCRCNT